MEETLEARIERLERKIPVLEAELNESLRELRAIRAELDGQRPATRKMRNSWGRLVETVPATKRETPNEEGMHAEKPSLQSPPPAERPAFGAGMESYIGGNLVSKIGVVLVLAGLAVFVKYAVDNAWLGPLARIALSYTAAGGLIFAAWRTIDKYKTFGSVLFAGGTAAAYFTTYAAYDWFDVAYIPRMPAFGIMAGLTVFAVAAAAKYKQEAIGLFGMVGAYVVPFLLSDGSRNFTGLLSYYAVVNAGMLAAAYFNDWRTSVWVATTATWLTQTSIYAFYYNEDGFPDGAVFGFSVYFFLLFYAAILVHKVFRHAKIGAGDVFFILFNTAVFFVFGLIELKTSFGVGRWGQGLFAVGVGLLQCAIGYAIYQRRMTDPKIEPTLYLLAAGLGVAGLTTAVPVTLKGTWITLLWSAEAVALFTLAGATGLRFFSRLGLAVLLLATISLWIDLESGYYVGAELVFLFNRLFLTSLAYVAALFASLAVLHFYVKDEAVEGQTIFGGATADKIRRGISEFEKILKNVLPVWGAVAMYAVLMAEIAGYFNVRYDEFFKRFGHAYDAYQAGVLAAFTFAYLAAFMTAADKALPFASLRLALWSALPAVVAFAAFPVLFFLYKTDLDYRLGINPVALEYFGVLRWTFGLCLGALLFAGWRRFKAFAREYEFIARTRPWLVVLSHTIVLFFFSTELVRWFVTPENADEMLELVQKVGYSLLWGGYALGLLAAGFAFKDKIMRFLGIAIAGVTLAKLVVYDLENLPTVYRIIAFILIGAVFLLISYLYQRYGKDLKDD